jgi:hypothetical protein
MLTLPLGKYRGWLLEDAPGTYLHGLLQQRDLRDPLRSAVEEELGFRDEAASDPAAGRPPTAWASVIRIWHEEMRASFHPDCGGHPEAIGAIDIAAKRLRELTNVPCKEVHTP